jgi:ribosomal protein S13
MTLWSKKFLAICGYNTYYFCHFKLLEWPEIDTESVQYSVLSYKSKRLKQSIQDAVDYQYRIYDLFGHYKVKRLVKGLPTRGQRTHSNASSCRKLNKQRLKRQMYY